MKHFILFFCLALSSCNSLLEIDSSPNIIERKDIYTSESNVLAALNGIYVHMRNSNFSFANGGLTVYLGLYTDELTYHQTNANYLTFYTNKLNSDNSILNSMFWSEPYRLIYRANSIIEGISNQSVLPDSFRKQVMGELLLIRSFVYFNLVQLYGDVPLITSTDYKHNQFVERIPKEKVLDQIISDLEEAHKVIGADYPSAGKARPNKVAVQAFLARVYLAVGNWPKAEALSSGIISEGAYPLITGDLTKAFEISSPETIWEIASKNEAPNSAEGMIFIPTRSTIAPTFRLSDQLISKFDSQDKRLTDWIGYNTIAGVKQYYPLKYKNRSAIAPVTEYNIVLRISEQYLIASEANLKLKKQDKALFYLNEIRKRSGITELSAAVDESTLSALILEERQRELFAEWGLRWLDLKRLELLDTILGSQKPNWKTAYRYFPIPTAQLNTNIFLTPNDGY